MRLQFAAALLLCLPGCSAAAETAVPEAGFSGMQAHRIEEPVFGGQMVVYEAGRGHARSVLLVHGIGPNGARDWRDTVGWLQESFHVVAVDLPGFGASDKANLLYSPANYAAALKHVADRFLRRPFVLVGHSMGAVVSLRYTITHPEDVERLVVMDVPGILHRYSVTSQFLATLGMEFVPPWLNLLEQFAELARRILAPLERLRFEPQIILASPQLRERILGGDPAKIAGLALVSEDLSTDLPRVRAETLILWGAEDRLAPLRTGRVLALKLPRARLEVIEGAGHTPMLEAPERFRAVLRSFLHLGLPGAPPASAASAANHGTGQCLNERNRVFEGHYDRLTIEGCTQVRIRNARVRELLVLDSSVTIDDSRIGGGETGLYARNSTVVATGGRIEGEVAITALESRIDLAAVEVQGSKAAVSSPTRTFVVFSFSRVRSPNTQGDVHAFFTVTPAHPL